MRCWPQYRSKEGSRYDWAMVRYDTDGGEPLIYPGKILALYEDENGQFRALVHGTKEKIPTKKEGPHGDTKLVTHYRLEFQPNGHPKLYSLEIEKILSIIVGYEANVYPEEPLVPRVRSPVQQKKHTLMVIRPREEWAKLYLDWTRELRNQLTTVNGEERHRLDIDF